MTRLFFATAVLLLGTTIAQADTLAIAVRASGNRRVTVRHFPATNHLFLPDSNGAFTHYAALTDTRVRREVLGALAEWMATVMK